MNVQNRTCVILARVKKAVKQILAGKRRVLFNQLFMQIIIWMLDSRHASKRDKITLSMLLKFKDPVKTVIESITA